MNEKEKMLKGELYNPTVEKLTGDRTNCKILCQKYNNLAYDNFEERTNLIKTLFKKTKGKFFIEQPFYCDYGYNIEIGENFYSNHNLIILDPALVTFGNNVFIGPNCGFYTAEHPIDYKIRNQELEYAKPITIGNNVWIGGSCTILSGVTIGNNVVVAAGAVVKSDVHDNCIVAGVPAKKIKDIKKEVENAKN